MFYSEFKYIFNLYMTICVDYLKPADINTYLNLYRVVQSLVLTVLDQSITIIFFCIGWQHPISKRPQFFILFKWYQSDESISKMTYELIQ
jgi:hypothetical protein